MYLLAAGCALALLATLLWPQAPGRGVAQAHESNVVSHDPLEGRRASYRPTTDEPPSDAATATVSAASNGLAPAAKGLVRLLALAKQRGNCEARGLCVRALCEVWTGSDRIGCFQSNCSPDVGATCGPGDWCQEFGSGTQSVWRCAPDGTAQLGARCVPARFANRGLRCADGRPCIAGICSRPCEPGSECSSRMSCTLVDGTGFCLPSGVVCERTADCLEGRPCVEGVCAQRMEIRPGLVSCAPGECPRGEVCDGELVGNGLWAECRKLCPAKRCQAGMRCVTSGSLAAAAEVCEPMCPCEQGEGCMFPANAPHDGTCRPVGPIDPEHSSGVEWQEAFAGPPDSFPDAGPY